MSQKLLVLELWGLGDLTLSTPLLHEAHAAGWEVHLTAKPYARALLEPTFPDLQFHCFDAPWTRYRGKYRVWAWNWVEIARWIWRLRQERFDAIVSVRNDPRDHFVMRLLGAPQRIGFPMAGSNVLLSEPATRSRPIQHKVEDWRDLAVALGLPGQASPRLDHAAYRNPRVDALGGGRLRPLLCLHTGARIAARRWPMPYFKTLLEKMREVFDFHLILIPDPDGYGSELAPMADGVATDLSVPELVDLLGRCDLLLCNDSGPAHLAAACGRPTLTVFGPSAPEWFRPWGPEQKVIIRDICPWRPCFDYCRFPEPYCMTRLEPAYVWHEVREQIHRLMESGALTPAILAPVATAS